MKLSDIVWKPSQQPLPASGLLIYAAEYPLFKAKLASFTPEQKARLKLAHGSDVAVLLGANQDLPWIPGALYLGQASGVTNLYLPTTLSPSLPIALIASAVATLFGTGQYAIDPKHHQCFNISAALPLSRIDPETLP
ncbi:hypothetical protein [Leucothrix mucor]|uniref:bpX5 domain-containing protein n=1 Tax=Leucothrix mucor TaxID=45248 RepID=UPI0003B45783|nr:hypothetical protein [Leucothrix mucor]